MATNGIRVDRGSERFTVDADVLSCLIDSESAAQSDSEDRNTVASLLASFLSSTLQDVFT